MSIDPLASSTGSVIAPRTLLIGLVAVGIAAAGYAWISRTHHTAVQERPMVEHRGTQIIVPEGSPLRAKLVVDQVVAKEIQRSLSLPASVEPDPSKVVKMMPPLGGRITELKVRLGDRVTAGQPLVVMDSPDLAQAYADYEKARSTLAFATRNRDRQRDLAKLGGAAQKDMQQAESDYGNAQAEADRAAARLREIGAFANIQSQSRQLTITAPIAGSIIDLTVAPGAYWNDATQPLMTIASLDTIWVTANVPEKDVAQVKTGQPVDVLVTSYPNKPFHGTVQFVSDVVDPDTRRVKVRVVFPNPDMALKPGMFATATFLAETQKLPAIPTTAIVLNNDQNRVFVEVAPFVFEPRVVETGYEQNGTATVTSGLAAGDRIIMKGGVLIND